MAIRNNRMRREHRRSKRLRIYGHRARHQWKRLMEWEERIQKKEGTILKEIKEANVIRSSSDSMEKGMKAEREEKKQETRKKRLGRALRRGFG